MNLDHLLQSLEATSFATAIRESTWLFPTIETMHVLAITMTVGSILMVDVRLSNFASRDRTVTSLAAEMLPWTWTSFVLAVATGLGLFSSHAVKYAGNFDFRVKMLLLLLAGSNMLVFHFGAYRNVLSWDAEKAPWPARLAGGVSLIIWVSVVCCGRWIGFTTS